MTQHSTIEYYADKALELIQPYDLYDQLAKMGNLTDLGTAKGATEANFPTEKEPAGDVTPLAATGPAASDPIDNVLIPIAFTRYGNDYEPCNAAWDLEAPYPVFEAKINTRAKAGMATVNKLAAAKLFATIPATGAYNHVYNTIANVLTENVVHLGNDPSLTKAARNLVDSTNVFNDEQLARKALAYLSTRKTPRFALPNGANTYVAIAPSYVIADIKKYCSGWQDFALHYQQGEYIAQGIVGQWEGFYWIEADANAIYTGLGAGGINVYPVLFMGSTFLGKVFRGCADLPIAKGAESSVTRIPVNEYMEVRVNPGSDAQGLVTNISYLMELGYGIVNPKASYRVEVAASLG